MIKLTQVNFKLLSNEELPIMVNINQVSVIEEFESYRRISFSSGYTIYVKETIDYINSLPNRL